MKIIDTPHLDGVPADPAARTLAQILAPLPGDAPCGAPVRFDPVFTEIRLLREEDDPSLPMGQWERPLKVADWAQVEARCLEMLGYRSKHLQIAVWLVEAWMRQDGYAGLQRGLAMLQALLGRYWSALHPLIEEDGDSEARIAPLEWLSESLSLGVRLHASLAALPDCRPASLTLAEWERMTAEEMHGAPPGAADAPTRAAICAAAAQAPAALRATRACLGHSLAALDGINALLREQLGDAAPNLARLHATLDAARRVLLQLEPALEGAGQEAPEPSALPVADPGAVVPAETSQALAAPDSSPAPGTGGWRNRAEAYATLAALADYLMELEPHSPVPFLIQRALHWSGMPLPELIAEIIREEGDLNRLVHVLGLKV